MIYVGCFIAGGMFGLVLAAALTLSHEEDNRREREQMLREAFNKGYQAAIKEFNRG